MNAKASESIRDSKKGRGASSTKMPFNWLPLVIICIVLLILIAGGVIAWFLLFAPKSPKIIKFNADPNSIEVGQFTTLSWEIKNASIVEIKPIGVVELSGEIQAQPIQTTEYTLIGKNEKGKTETRTLTVEVEDITPPIISITHVPSSPNTNQKVEFIASATDAGGISKVEIAVNGELVKSCTSTPCTYEGGPYPEGEISYTGIGYDESGNKGSSGSKTFRVNPSDETPPRVDIKHSPSSPNTNQKVEFIASATDAGGISKVEIAVNGELVKSCTSTPCTYEGGPYPEGEISYTGIGYDESGNKGSSGSKTFRVNPSDETPPRVDIKHSPSSPNTNQKVEFIASATDAGGINKVEIAVNGELVKSCTSTPCTYEGGPYPLGVLKYGAYAYDKAGNRKWSGAESLRVIKPVIVPTKPIEIKPIEIPPVRPRDKTPPSVDIKHSPSSPKIKQKVLFTANAADAGGISKVEIAVNGRIVKSCREAPCTYEGGPYPLGVLKYGAYAYDKAGNRKWSGAKSLNVIKTLVVPTRPEPVKPIEIPPVKPIEIQPARPKDTTPPRVGIRYSPSNPNTTQKILFTASASDTEGISKVEIMVNGRIVKSCTSAPCSYEGGPYPLGILNYGANAYDKSGNKASTGLKSLTVSKPVLVPIKPIEIPPIKPIEIPPVKPIEIPPVKSIEIQPARPKDTTPPRVGIRYSPSNPNTTQKILFTASASDTEGISKVEIVVNGRIVKSCTSAPCSYEGGPYSLGILNYGANAYDKSGNKASTGSKSLTVSKPVLVPIKPIEIPPIKPIEIPPIKPIEIPPVKPIEIPPVKSIEIQPARPKDTTPPRVGIRYSPSNPNTTQKILFTASASDTEGISKVEIMVNGRIVKSCRSAPCSYEGGPFPLGSLSYGANAYDKSGNKASTGSKSLTVSRSFLMPIKPVPIRPKDTTPPSVGIRHSPASPNTLQKVIFSANASDTGGISKVEIAVNGKVVKSCTSTPCTYEGGPFPLGSLNYGANAYDKSGNKASTGSKSLTVNKPVLMPIKRIPIQPIPQTIK